MLRRCAAEKTALSCLRCRRCWPPSVVSTLGPRKSLNSLFVRVSASFRTVKGVEIQIGETSNALERSGAFRVRVRVLDQETMHGFRIVHNQHPGLMKMQRISGCIYCTGGSRTPRRPRTLVTGPYRSERSFRNFHPLRAKISWICPADSGSVYRR